MVPLRQSDPILWLIESAQAVEDTVTVQGPRIAERLGRRFASWTAALAPEGATEGGREPDFLLILYMLRDELASSREELASIEEDHIDVQREITASSKERAARLEDLESDYTWLRGNLEKLLGEGQSDLLAGFQGPTEQKSMGLLRQVRLAVRVLSRPDLEIHEQRLGVFKFDPKETAAQLTAKADGFRDVLARLRQLRGREKETQTDKNRMVERHKKTFFPVTRTLEGYFRLAGEDELADRIRPSEVKRGRRAAEVEGSPDGDCRRGGDRGLHHRPFRVRT